MRSDFYEGGDVSRDGYMPVPMPETIYVERSGAGYLATEAHGFLETPYLRHDIARMGHSGPPLWNLVSGIVIGAAIAVVLLTVWGA